MIIINLPYAVILCLLTGFFVTAQVHRPKIWRYITGLMVLGSGRLVIRPFNYTEISISILLLSGGAYFGLSIWPFVKKEWFSKPNITQKNMKTKK